MTAAEGRVDTTISDIMLGLFQVALGWGSFMFLFVCLMFDREIARKLPLLDDNTRLIIKVVGLLVFVGVVFSGILDGLWADFTAEE